MLILKTLHLANILFGPCVKFLWSNVMTHGKAAAAVLLTMVVLLQFIVICGCTHQMQKVRHDTTGGNNIQLVIFLNLKHKVNIVQEP